MCIEAGYSKYIVKDNLFFFIFNVFIAKLISLFVDIPVDRIIFFLSLEIFSVRIN